MTAGYDLIIRNGVVVTDIAVQEQDIAVKDGKIARITPKGGLNVASATKVIDAEGGYVMVEPYFPLMHHAIDLNNHSLAE